MCLEVWDDLPASIKRVLEQLDLQFDPVGIETLVDLHGEAAVLRWLRGVEARTGDEHRRLLASGEYGRMRPVDVACAIDAVV